jgi:hypothetical protein
MGVGTNVQARAVALHHVDCPWRPADIEQREGRILRQGNLNRDVEILRYVTESSFDVFMWGTVERKAGFIAQVTRGDATLARQLDDVGEQSLSYGEVKALATGNPLIMEKAGVDSEVAKLERMASAHAGEQRRLAKTIAGSGPTIERLHRDMAKIERALALRTDISGDAFRATITGVTCEKRADAGDRIKAALVDARYRHGETIGIGNLAGLDLTITVKGEIGEDELHLCFPDAPLHPTVIGATDIDREHPVGLVSRLANRLGDLEERLADDARELGSATANAEQASAMIGRPFDQMPRLVALRNRQVEITEALTPKPGPETEPGSASASISEEERRGQGPDCSDYEVANSLVTAFPTSIGDALVTARTVNTSLTRHHGRSSSLSPSDIGR